MARTSQDLDPRTLASLAPDARAKEWKRVLDVLAADSSDEWEPVAFAVWNDFLNEPDRCTDTWQALVEPVPAPRVLARLLDLSGPVPADSKLPLLEQLADDHQWHDSVIRALWFAIFEDRGDIDVPRARTLARRIHPSMAVSEYDDVVATLADMPDDCRSHRDWRERVDGPDQVPHLASARAKNRLERRRGDRRRRTAGPPAAAGERRVTVDRRRSFFGRVRKRR